MYTHRRKLRKNENKLRTISLETSSDKMDQILGNETNSELWKTSVLLLKWRKKYYRFHYRVIHCCSGGQHGQWRSQSLPGWASRPPGRPKWGRKWRNFEEMRDPIQENEEGLRKCSYLAHPRERPATPLMETFHFESWNLSECFLLETRWSEITPHFQFDKGHKFPVMSGQLIWEASSKLPSHPWPWWPHSWWSVRPETRIPGQTLPWGRQFFRTPFWTFFFLSLSKFVSLFVCFF